jgi:outer membrane receptor protein involved in Fe transport
MNKYLFIFYLSLFFLSNPVFAQTGTIQGQIIDTTANEGVIGANVVIKGTTIGSSTDVEGKYLIPNVVAGTYTIVVSSIGYRSKEIDGVVVQAGKAITLNVKLTEESQQLQDVVVQAERETYSEISVISEIKLSQVVAVGVSGEQISKTQDSDGAAVLRRLPGISLFDERFIMVRGLGERYNAVLLNGALTPSTEVDVKSFSFDVIPSSVIDRMLVLKSGAPHLPGEYAGGIIQIFTKNAPDENFTSLSISGGYRLGTTFKDMLKYEGGSNDWLGFGSSTRRLPDNFPTQEQLGGVGNPTLGASSAKQLSTTWLPTTFKASPDFKISLGLGRRFKIGSVKISNLTSISYNNTRQFLQIDRNRYGVFDFTTQKIKDDLFKYKDEQSNQTVRIGAIHNWSISLNKDHKIEFRNLFNQLGSTQTTFRQGDNFSNGQEYQNYSLYYENRSIYSGQLAGKHTFGNSSFDWLVGLSYTNRQEPDFRRVRTQRSIGSASDVPYVVPFANGLSFQQNGRFFSNLNEYVYTNALNFEHKVKFKGSEENPLIIKAGTYVERKNRNFNSRVLTLNSANPGQSTVDVDFAFDPNNLRPDLYYIFDGTTPDYSYYASNTLYAGYASVNIPFNEKWNLITGLRFEYNDQRLDSDAPSDAGGGKLVKVKNQIASLLPSVNLSYNISDKMLLRAAYTSSINRPEFRELAPLLYYDFNQDLLVNGNDTLKTPKIYNVDLRWEFYPTPAEVIMIGAFYKRFVNPIETVPADATNPTPLLTFLNADYANSYGLEIEIRKSLASIIKTPLFENISAVINASFIYNRVQLPKAVKNQISERPMMNQSPYLINAGFYYNNEGADLQISLLYNVFGRRIFYAGDVSAIAGNVGFYPPAYEMPRNTIDLSIAKGLGEKVEVKFGVTDILNARYRFVQDSNRDGKITGIDSDLVSYRRGQNFSLSFKYNF